MVLVHIKFKTAIKQICEEIGLNFNGTNIGIIANGNYQGIPITIERKSTLAVSNISDAAATIPERIIIHAGEFPDDSPVKISFFRIIFLNYSLKI